MLELAADISDAAPIAQQRSMEEQIAKDAALALLLQSEESGGRSGPRQMDAGSYFDFLQHSAASLTRSEHADRSLLAHLDAEMGPGGIGHISEWMPSVSDAGRELLEEASSFWTFARASDDEGDEGMGDELNARVLKGGAASRKDRAGQRGPGQTGLHRRRSWHPSSIPVD